MKNNYSPFIHILFENCRCVLLDKQVIFREYVIKLRNKLSSLRSDLIFNLLTLNFSSFAVKR